MTIQTATMTGTIARRWLWRARFEGSQNGLMRKQADVRFYAELNHFLVPWRRGGATPYTFEVSGSVKDIGGVG